MLIGDAAINKTATKQVRWYMIQVSIVCCMSGGGMQLRAGQERREHPRKRVEIAVFLSCDGDVDQFHKVSVYDISLSGMAINPGNLVSEIGDKLCLCLSVTHEPCGREHVIEATVVHLHEGLVGVRFDSVGVHVLKDIHALLRDERTF